MNIRDIRLREACLMIIHCISVGVECHRERVRKRGRERGGGPFDKVDSFHYKRR